MMGGRGLISLVSLISLMLERFVSLSLGFVIISLAASAKQYELGSSYNYEYQVGLEMSEPSLPLGHPGYRYDNFEGSTVGYRVIGQVQVRSVWQSDKDEGSLLQIQLIKPQLQIKSRKAPQPDGFRDHSSNLDSITLHPIYAQLREGVLGNIYSVKNDDVSLVNIKKGIVNILQVQTGEGQRFESSPAGLCQVTFDTRLSSHITKTVSKACDNSGRDYPFRSHINGVLGSQVESEINATINLSRDSSFVETVEVDEIHTIRVNAKREVGAKILASQSLRFTGTTSSNKVYKASTLEQVVKEIGKTSELDLVTDSLAPKLETFPTCEQPNCKSFETLSQSLTEENMATTKMAYGFVQMVTKFRHSKINEIKPLIKSNLRTFPQILDVCAAAGTYDIHQIVMKELNFHLEDDISKPERYLLGLSLSPNPSPEVLQELFKLVKRSVPSAKLQETLLLTTAAVAYTISENNHLKHLPRSHLILEIEDYLLTALSSCTGESGPECRQLYLRSLKNLKSNATLPAMFDLLQTGNSKTSVVAMKSIHAFSDALLFKDEFRRILIKVIRQLGRKYDSSARTLAIDVILRYKPTKQEVTDVLTSLLEKVADKAHAEVATFMWNRLQEFAVTNPQLEVWAEEIVSARRLRDYHHLSPRGLSTAFSRTFTSNPSGNSTFSNAIEMSGKILKRSLFDVIIKSQEDDHALQLLSLGIFADGLGSFASDSSSSAEAEASTEDEEEATAGMELTLMSVQMRPLVFFVGKGDLMGLVWSGAGSERTSALQGNVMLQDDWKVIPLYNGLIAEVNIQGGLSFDLAGQIQLSLWHRTANSLVENKAGLVLQSVVRADTSFVRSRIDYTIAAEANLHFTSDINFYQGVVMCLKLTQPEFKVRQNIHKTERIPGSKHKLRKAKYKTILVPGLTYALNKKNSHLCSLMYKDEL